MSRPLRPLLLFCSSTTAPPQFLMTFTLSLLCFHMYLAPPPSLQAQFHFPAVTEKGRRSCLLMAPGACGSRLANQCESTSGTSLGQTISLSAHSACCQPPPPQPRPFPSGSQAGRQAGTPRAAVCAHTSARHFPKPSQSSWHLGRLSPPYPPVCSANIPRGPEGSGGQTLPPLSIRLIGVSGGWTHHAVHHGHATCGDYLTAFHPGL